MMADATNNSTSSSSNSSNNNTAAAGEPIPQWKKELLQRRKNLAKTIGTAATQVHDSASTVAAALTASPTTPRVGGPSGGNPFGSGGQKDPSVVAAPSIVADISVPSEPATSPTPSASSSIDSSSCSNNNNNNGDSPASPTAATTPTSLFGAPVFVGHSPPAAAVAVGNEPPAQPVLVKSAFVGGATNTAASSSAATRAAEVPLHATPQSHSNDGPESTSCSTSRSLSHLHSSNNSNSGASSGGPVGKYAAATSGSGISASASVDCELKRPASSGETSSNSYSSEIGCWKSKKNTSSASSSSSSPKMVAASAEEIIYEKNPRFVGPGAEGATVDVDPSEELKYGPGIVSKLRCRYLSLALRQSANKQRPSLNNMRRATSLNNLLDEEGEDLSEREQSIEAKDHHHQTSQDKGYFQQHQQQGKFGQVQSNQMMMNAQQLPKAKTPDEYISTFQKSVQNSYTRSGRQTEKKNEYNRYNKQRGADSLKRARSVEALVRYDHKAWERDIQKENLYSSNDSNVIILDEISCTNGTNGTNANNNNNNCQSVAMNKAELITDCVTIEEKIINGREKGDPKPKRLTSFIDADERPPPDVVRQTMKIFEANANRRGRPVARTNGAAGEVAAKVASYKSIISQEKPPITHPKPPLSPKKPNIIPRTTSPKPNGTPVPATAANGLKDKPNLPKLDINVIRTNLETTNNLKNSATPTPTSTTPPQPAANHNNNITTSAPPLPPPLSVRVVESQTYRLKYDSPALSPNNTAVAPHKVTSSTTTNRPESPRACMQNNTNSTALAFVDSPSIPTLASKLGSLNIVTSTPTSTRSPTPQDLPPQAPPRHVPLQYATSDEEDPDDPEDQQHEYSINTSDREDEDEDYQSDDLEPEGDDEFDSQEVKKVSRAAMDNISKAGVTTQFRFNGQQSQQNKSHLPALAGGAKLLSSKKLNVDDHHHHHQSSNSSSSSSSPITVPAAATAAAPVVIAHKPPVPLSRESLAATNGLKPANNNNNSNIGSVTHNSSNVSSNSSVSSSNNGSKVVINDSVAPAPPNVVSVASDVSSAKTVNLTAREIEKNQINLEKSEESLNNSVAPANSASVVLAKSELGTSSSSSSSSSSGGDFFMAKWGGVAQKPAETGAAAIGGGSPLAGLVPTKKKVKAPPPPIEANTMVFNFSDRKEVPDYIENDGIILRPRPRELPKPGESGFVVLGDLTLETSTDPDDSWAMGPPSPCDVEFANANIVINGKSSMRNKTARDSKFKIQFDDSLTSTFEYPSETSLLETNGYGDDTTDAANGLKDAAAILASVTLNSSSTTNGGGQQPAATATADSGGGGGLTFGDNGLLSHKNNLLSSMPLVIPQ